MKNTTPASRAPNLLAYPRSISTEGIDASLNPHPLGSICNAILREIYVPEKETTYSININININTNININISININTNTHKSLKLISFNHSTPRDLLHDEAITPHHIIQILYLSFAINLSNKLLIKLLF